MQNENLNLRLSFFCAKANEHRAEKLSPGFTFTLLHHYVKVQKQNVQYSKNQPAVV